ncbi:MAG: VWA domain-containing protein [Polyangiaceae bacterium]|nr:VWA domain-containing protein [Polyangiaceae bacterium]
MKLATFIGLAVAGMVGVGSAVYAVTPAGGFGAKRDVAASQQAVDEADELIAGSADAPRVDKTPTEFRIGSTLVVEGRVGHPAMRANQSSESFVLLELTPGEGGAATAPPAASVSLVIDKSGSMKGARLPNAVAAAVAAVDRLRDGDSVSVIAFDTKTEVVVPPTKIDASTRPTIASAIRGIQLGGDTCISCGLSEALAQLTVARTNGARPDVERVLLLSDGEPTAGMRKPEEFNVLARRAMTSGISITTIGVALDYNEQVMTAIARSSNGGHYFVENEAGLPAVFEAEAKKLEETRAANAVAHIELKNGVELMNLPDREFQRFGSRITVPLGGFAKGMKNTVLLKVRVPATQAGPLTVADIRVAYRDLSSAKDVEETGSLAIDLVTDPSKIAPIDGVVLDRVQRTETAAALIDANSLFREGRVDEAEKRLEQARQSVQKSKKDASVAVPASRAGGVASSFDQQEESLDKASSGFKRPAPGRPAEPNAPKATSRSNAQRAFESTQ